MRVLYIASPDVAIDKGGLYTQVINTKKCLEKLGVEIDLYDIWHPLENSYDLVHIFRADISLLDSVKRFKSRGMKIVLTPIFASTHLTPTLRLINISNECVKRLKISSRHLYLKRSMELADVITPNSEEEITSLSRGFGIPRDKFRKIPNGVEESFYYADPKEFKTKYGHEDYLLYTGWIGSARKNTLRLLKALKRIGKKAILIGRVVDEGAYTERCLSFSKQNPNIVILDPIPHTSSLLASAYAGCATFVLPSLFETPGLSALEAGLAGANIVITNRGGTKEYYGDMVEYINPRSTTSVVNAINRSIKKDKSERLREYIRNNFLWDNIAERILNTYKWVTQKNF